MYQEETAFKSALTHTIATAPMQTGHEADWLDWAQRTVTPEELRWTEFPEHLHEAAVRAGGEMMSRETVLAIAEAGALHIKTLVADKNPQQATHRNLQDGHTRFSGESLAATGEYPYQEILLVQDNGLKFPSHRWPGVTDILAEIRLTDLKNGTLFVEELRSEQAEFVKNFSHDAYAPFVDSTEKWLTLALQKTVHVAAEQGFERIAIISGSQAAQRARLEQTATRLELSFDRTKEVYTLRGKNQDGQPTRFAFGTDRSLQFSATDARDVLGNLLGDEITTRLLRQEQVPVKRGYRQTLEGEAIAVGGKEMREFYDRTVPDRLELLTMNLGEWITPEDTQQPATGNRQVTFAITDALRTRVLEGQWLFEPHVHGKQQTTEKTAPKQADGLTAAPASPDFSGCAVPRDAGKLAWEAIGGDLNRLPEIIPLLEAQGYRVDQRHLQNLPDNPLVQRDAFLKAVGEKPRTQEQPRGKTAPGREH